MKLYIMILIALVSLNNNLNAEVFKSKTLNCVPYETLIKGEIYTISDRQIRANRMKYPTYKIQITELTATIQTIYNIGYYGNYSTRLPYVETKHNHTQGVYKDADIYYNNSTTDRLDVNLKDIKDMELSGKEREGIIKIHCKE